MDKQCNIRAESKFEWAIMVHLKPFKCFIWLQDSGVGMVSKVGY